MSRHTPNVSRAMTTALASAALLALAACGGEPAEPAPAEVPAGTTAAPEAAAAPGGVQERLTTADCRQPGDGRIFFDLGGAVLAVPAERIVTVVPPDVSPGTDAAAVVQRLRAATEAGAGCPEQPLEAGLVSVAAQGADPLLADQIAVVRSRAGEIAQPYAELTRNLLQNADRCRDLEGGLIACAGAETVGDQQRPIMYLVTTEPGRTLAFGGPLAARCALQQNQIQGCEIVDELPGNIAIRAPMRALPQSTDALAAAHRAAVRVVESLRR